MDVQMMENIIQYI